MATGIIYKATNKINGKCYIGQTYGKFEHRKTQHFVSAFNINSKNYDCYFHRAIRKYGKETWEWEIISYNIPIEMLNFMEISAIYLYGSFGGGYNSTSGGENGRIVSEETKNKISASNKGKILSNETKKKISENHANVDGNNNPMFGKKRLDLAERNRKNKGKKLSPFTDEHKLKMSEAQRGKNNPMYGKHHSKETRNKMSEARKGRQGGMKGKRHTEETKKKMSETRIGKKRGKYKSRAIINQ